MARSNKISRKDKLRSRQISQKKQRKKQAEESRVRFRQPIISQHDTTLDAICNNLAGIYDSEQNEIMFFPSYNFNDRFYLHLQKSELETEKDIVKALSSMVDVNGEIDFLSYQKFIEEAESSLYVVKPGTYKVMDRWNFPAFDKLEINKNTPINLHNSSLSVIREHFSEKAEKDFIQGKPKQIYAVYSDWQHPLGYPSREYKFFIPEEYSNYFHNSHAFGIYGPNSYSGTLTKNGKKFLIYFHITSPEKDMKYLLESHDKIRLKMLSFDELGLSSDDLEKKGLDFYSAILNSLVR